MLDYDSVDAVLAQVHVTLLNAAWGAAAVQAVIPNQVTCSCQEVAAHSCHAYGQGQQVLCFLFAHFEAIASVQIKQIPRDAMRVQKTHLFQVKRLTSREAFG